MCTTYYLPTTIYPFPDNIEVHVLPPPLLVSSNTVQQNREVLAWRSMQLEFCSLACVLFMLGLM